MVRKPETMGAPYPGRVSCCKVLCTYQLGWNLFHFWPGFHYTCLQKIPNSIDLFVLLLVTATPAVVRMAETLLCLSRTNRTAIATMHTSGQVPWDPPTVTLQSTSDTSLVPTQDSHAMVFVSCPQVIIYGLLFSALFAEWRRLLKFKAGSGMSFPAGKPTREVVMDA